MILQSEIFSQADTRGEPSGYCIQMLYPLGWLIAATYRAIRKISWYGLFFVRMSIWCIGIDCMETAFSYEKGMVTGNPAHTGRRTGIWTDGKRTGYFTVQCDQWLVHGRGQYSGI